MVKYYFKNIIITVERRRRSGYNNSQRRRLERRQFQREFEQTRATMMEGRTGQEMIQQQQPQRHLRHDSPQLSHSALRSRQEQRRRSFSTAILNRLAFLNQPQMMGCYIAPNQQPQFRGPNPSNPQQQNGLYASYLQQQQHGLRSETGQQKVLNIPLNLPQPGYYIPSNQQPLFEGASSSSQQSYAPSGQQQRHDINIVGQQQGFSAPMNQRQPMGCYIPPNQQL
uniref:Uncharacterized protein n=1 Tax=Glossina brevipalpis TaxID=37001 RepID=A0A1A9WDX5_9MUSC